MPTLSSQPGFKALQEEASKLKVTHLRELLKDDHRNEAMVVEFQGMVLDYCREKVSEKTMDLLFQVAEQAKLKEKIAAMYAGDHINATEDRSVYHMALRAKADGKMNVDGKNVVPDVHQVLGRIKRFASQIRAGEWVGHTGKPLKDLICIGIGGSYLGPECVFEALRTDPEASTASSGRRLHFLANVDPIDVKRALEGFHPETTLTIIISKTFTTAETMLNAKTVKDWYLKSLNNASAISRHMVACSTNIAETNAFGINPDNVFAFWDWVGGRFSVCSAVGVLPLAIHFGFPVVQKFLDGCNAMDTHFATAPFNKNIPVLLGLLGVWNSTFMGYEGNAILPYCQALTRLAAHIQQVNMESNGKRVTMSGEEINYPTGPIVFGEPGTNGQHSFYQLIHQGRTVPCEFLGFCNSQNPVYIANEAVPNHDELMANFFAQPDALAFGKSAAELQQEGVKASLVPHKTFPGDRPSLSLLMPECNATYVGMLIALYEHRTAVEGFLWDVNSFDQWGVELGKVLAKEVRGVLSKARRGQAADESHLPKPTRQLLKYYIQRSQ